MVDFNYSGLYEIAFTWYDISTNPDLPALLLNGFNSLAKYSDFILCVNRPQKYPFLKLIAFFYGLIGLDHFPDKFIINRLLNDDSAGGRAALTSRAQTAKNAGFQRKFKVCIFHDNCRSISTKFQYCPSKSLSNIDGYFLSNGC